MRPRAGFPLGVALAFADGIVSNRNGSGAGVHHARIEGVPAILVAAVAIDDDYAGQFAMVLLRPVDDGRNPYSELGSVGDALGDDARHRFELAMRFGREG